MIRSSSSADIELQTLRERGVRTAESDPPPSDYTVTACSHLRRRHKNVGDGEISLKLLCYATAIDTARRVQAVYDGTSLLVRRRTILPGDLITPSAAATVRRGLRSAASSTVAVPRTTSSLGDRSYAAAGPRAWNKLPPPLRRVFFCCYFQTST